MLGRRLEPSDAFRWAWGVDLKGRAPKGLTMRTYFVSYLSGAIQRPTPLAYPPVRPSRGKEKYILGSVLRD